MKRAVGEFGRSSEKQLSLTAATRTALSAFHREFLSSESAYRRADRQNAKRRTPEKRRDKCAAADRSCLPKLHFADKNVYIFGCASLQRVSIRLFRKMSCVLLILGRLYRKSAETRAPSTPSRTEESRKPRPRDASGAQKKIIKSYMFAF